MRKYKFPVDSTNNQGQTPLHLVCIHTPLDVANKIVKVLVVTFGADLHPRDNDGNEPVVLAVRAGRTELVESLALIPIK